MSALYYTPCLNLLSEILPLPGSLSVLIKRKILKSGGVGSVLFFMTFLCWKTFNGSRSSQPKPGLSARHSEPECSGPSLLTQRYSLL